MSPQELLQKAVASHREGRFADAERAYRAVLDLHPGHADILHQRGVCLQSLGRLDEALASYEGALAARGDFVAALCNRGAVLKDLRRFDDAIACFNRVLVLQPGFAPALVNRAATLLALGRFPEALQDSEQVLRQHPDLPQALNNRGVALKQLDRAAEALSCFDAALARTADDVVALENRGALLADLGRHADAARDFARALAIAPEAPYVRGALLHARMHCCDWSMLADDLAALQDGVFAGRRCAEPFVAIASCDAPDLHRACATTWMQDRCPPVEPPLWRGARYRHERLRVAYVSGDFRDHPVSQLMVELFERHDRSRFDVTGVSFGPATESPLRARVERAFEHFEDMRGRTDAEIAAWLRAREFDIAVDLQGFTHRARSGIFARRPAPVQASYMGYPGTLGAPWIDYVIADAEVIPPGRERDYAEQVVRMPWSYLVNDGQRRIADVAPSREVAGLPEAGFVFCSFNSSHKITPGMFDIWMRLLRGVDGSVLWLLNANPDATANLQREASRRGVDARRLVFAPRLPVAEHLARHRLADLFLDTLPYNAHTTASDALWAGLPVITCPGDAFAARVAASLLRAIGLPELVTASLPDYEATALHLARSPQALASIRATLAAQRGTWPLFDCARFARDIETAYAIMCERSRSGATPLGFAVPKSGDELRA